MIENNIAKMEIEMFNKKVHKFIQVSKEYSEKNVKIRGNVDNQNIKNQLNKIWGFQNDRGYLEVELFTEIPKEILMSLCELIQNFVQICETHDLSKPFSNRELEFISGVKFVNNVIKHKKKDFSITDLIVPDFKVEIRNDILDKCGVTIIPLEQVEFRLGANWAAVKREIADKMRKKDHLINYKEYLQNYDVFNTVIVAKIIIDCHIAK